MKLQTSLLSSTSVFSRPPVGETRYLCTIDLLLWKSAFQRRKSRILKIQILTYSHTDEEKISTTYDTETSAFSSFWLAQEGAKIICETKKCSELSNIYSSKDYNGVMKFLQPWMAARLTSFRIRTRMSAETKTEICQE